MGSHTEPPSIPASGYKSPPKEGSGKSMAEMIGRPPPPPREELPSNK